MIRSRAAVISQLGTVSTPRLNESRMRIRHYRKTPYDYLFETFIYHLKRGEIEIAGLIAVRLRKMKEEDEWEES